MQDQDHAESMQRPRRSGYDAAAVRAAYG